MKTDLYNLYVREMSNFDLFLWAGKGGFSDVIKRVTRSKYSHSSVGIWMQPILGYPPRYFNAESTTLNDIPDAIHGEFRKGVQIVNFEQRIEGYNGDLWWFQIKDPFTEKEQFDMMQWCLERHASRTKYDLRQAIDAVNNNKHAPLWAKVLTSPLALLTPTQEDLGRLFCSEMCCKLYQIGNKIPKEINPSSITPDELLHFNIYKEPVKLSL